MEPEELTPEERRLWNLLTELPPEPADSARMRARFDAALSAERALRRTRAWRPALEAVAAVLLVAVGIDIGRSTAPAAAPNPEIATMRQEVHDLRETVSLSLLQQQSASDRLRGVSWSTRIDEPADTVVRALLDTLMHDSDVNVRLATIDALKRFAAQQEVRRGMVAALQSAQSPLVQTALIDFMVETHARDAAPLLRRLASDAQVYDTVRKRAAWAAQQVG
jgi:hypothetical protein